MKTGRKKGLALALATLLVLGGMTVTPLTAQAAKIQAGVPNITIGTSSPTPTTIGFGGHEWVVIGYGGDGVANESDTMTLLLKNDDTGGGYGTTQFHNSSNHYSGSDLQDAMDAAYGNLSSGEKALVKSRDLEGRSGNQSAGNYNDDNIAGETVPNAHFWPLSVNEANQMDNSVLVFDDCWWLRSPGDNDDEAAVIDHSSSVDAHGFGVFGNLCAIRPAFHLNLASALFTSAAEGGKSATVGSLSEATPPTGAVKLTVLDRNTSSLNLTVINTSEITATPGGTVNIDYTGAVIGTDKYVSAVLTDENGEVLYYGKLVDLETDGASGTASFTMPSDLANGGYKIKLFNEECNADNYTDFASEPVEINLTVTSGRNDNFAVGTWTGENGHRWVEFGDMVWRILGVKENDAEAAGCTTALLLAEESVGSRQFHTTWNSGDNDWNTSDIKAWLNNEICSKNSNDYTSNGFMSRFSDDEKGSIVTANYTYGGSYTGSETLGSSKVFLLSVDEANEAAYFADNADRKLGSGSLWWLRSPGNYDLVAAVVIDYGFVSAFGDFVNGDNAVRPALKINLASSIFTSKKPLVQAEITVTSGGSPVEGASISFTGASAPDGAILSGGEGKATARLELGESYTIAVSKAGYEPYTDTATITQADQAISVNLTPVTTPPTDGSDHSFGGGTSAIITTPVVTTPTAARPNQPTIGSVTAKVQGNSFTIIDSLIKSALDKAQSAAKPQNRTANGVGARLVLEGAPADGLTLTLERAALNRLITIGAKRFEITGTPLSLSFDVQALSQLQKQGTGNVTISTQPVTAKGVRNAHDITLTTVKDGKNVSITNLGTGTATLSIPTTPAKNEAAGSLYAVYVDDKGKTSRIEDSFYDANSGSVIFTTNHFSIYGVGDDTPTVKSTDIAAHWAKESIDYVMGRGLLNSNAQGKFNPNSAITRGELVTALGKLTGVNTKAYAKTSFTDVKADSEALPYIAWASSKGILKGITSSQFAPEKAVTRQEIALILQNFAKANGYTLPVTRTAVTFADASSIGNTYKTAVKTMQQAGIVMGEQNNKFNPTANITRAEASATLHRYIKLSIDPATAQGWAKNDDGQFQYYKDGKAVTGTQTIDGVKYIFTPNGTLKTGWVQEGSNWRYFSGNTMVTGWRNISTNGVTKRYYFDAKGNRISGKWQEIGGTKYYFEADGELNPNKK